MHVSGISFASDFRLPLGEKSFFGPRYKLWPFLQNQFCRQFGGFRRQIRTLPEMGLFIMLNILG